MNTLEITAIIKQSISVKQNILNDPQLLDTIAQAGWALVHTFKAKGRVYLCGNGGSAADAQHIAAELSGRFYHDRPPLPAEALHVNTSFLTAVANDYGYDQVFARMVQGFGTKSDVLIGISTSGKSPNVLLALKQAQDMGMTTIGLCGNNTQPMAQYCHHLIAVPSPVPPRLQDPIF